MYSILWKLKNYPDLHKKVWLVQSEKRHRFPHFFHGHALRRRENKGDQSQSRALLPYHVRLAPSLKKLLRYSIELLFTPVALVFIVIEAVSFWLELTIQYRYKYSFYIKVPTTRCMGGWYVLELERNHAPFVEAWSRFGPFS